MDNDCFYYSVHTAGGFHTGFFDAAAYDKTFAVTGGSAELRTRILEAAAERFDREKINYEICCSSDGIFALLCTERKILIADGETGLRAENGIDLNDLYNGLYPRELMRIYTCEKKKKADRCSRFLQAAESLKSELVRLDSQSIDYAKIVAFTLRLWKKNGGAMKGNIGRETKRFVSCITPDGVELNMKAFDSCDRISVVVDRTGAVSTRIVDRIRRYALGSGYDVTSFVCSLDGKTVEHIIIPELRFGVFSSEHYHRLLPKKERKIFASRFHTQESEKVKNRLGFTFKAYRSLMNEAFESMIGACEEEEKINYLFRGISDTKEAVDEIAVQLCD